MSNFKKNVKTRASAQIKFKGFFAKIKTELASDAIDLSMEWPKRSILGYSNKIGSVSQDWLENMLTAYLKENLNAQPKGFIDSIFWSYILQAVISAVVQWLLKQYQFDNTFFLQLAKEE